MTNTDIDRLIAEYEAEECDFSDMGWVINTSERHIYSMPDSLVRCLFHTILHEYKGLKETIVKHEIVIKNLSDTYNKVYDENEQLQSRNLALVEVLKFSRKLITISPLDSKEKNLWKTWYRKRREALSQYQEKVDGS